MDWSRVRMTFEDIQEVEFDVERVFTEYADICNINSPLRIITLLHKNEQNKL